MIDGQTVPASCSGAASEAPAFFQNQNAASGGTQITRGNEARDSGADDDNVPRLGFGESRHAQKSGAGGQFAQKILVEPDSRFETFDREIFVRGVRAAIRRGESEEQCVAAEQFVE